MEWGILFSSNISCFFSLSLEWSVIPPNLNRGECNYPKKKSRGNFYLEEKMEIKLHP